MSFWPFYLSSLAGSIVLTLHILIDKTILKGAVRWIFLSTYVVVLILGYTLLFIGTKTDQYFLRYLQKYAQILAVLKKRFIQEITVTWKATCRKMMFPS